MTINSLIKRCKAGVSVMGMIQYGETALTVFMCLCSEVSILRGSQQARTCAEPHMQLLPEHGRGRLGRSVVGRLLLHTSFSTSMLESEAGQHSGQVTLEWRGRPLKDVLCEVPFVCHAWSLSRRHTLPASQWEEAAGKGPEWYRETLKDGNPVIIYLHGNLGTRWDESSIEVLELMLMDSSVFQRPMGLSRGTMSSEIEGKSVWKPRLLVFIYIHIMSAGQYTTEWNLWR